MPRGKGTYGTKKEDHQRKVKSNGTTGNQR